MGVRIPHRPWEKDSACAQCLGRIAIGTVDSFVAVKKALQLYLSLTARSPPT
jgi:hypothetical protein